MDTKIQQFFDGAISAVIIFVTAYFFMSLSDMDAMTAVAASLALAFAGGALWRRIVRTDKRCKNYDAYLSRFIYRSPRQNAEKERGRRRGGIKTEKRPRNHSRACIGRPVQAYNKHSWVINGKVVK